MGYSYSQVSLALMKVYVECESSLSLYYRSWLLLGNVFVLYLVCSVDIRRSVRTRVRGTILVMGTKRIGRSVDIYVICVGGCCSIIWRIAGQWSVERGNGYAIWMIVNVNLYESEDYRCHPYSAG